jgi:hypothetical protein
MLLSVRPGSSLAICAHLLPTRLCCSMMMARSSSVNGSFLTPGASWLNQRSRQLLPFLCAWQRAAYQGPLQRSQPPTTAPPTAGGFREHRWSHLPPMLAAICVQLAAPCRSTSPTSCSSSWDGHQAAAFRRFVNHLRCATPGGSHACSAGGPQAPLQVRARTSLLHPDLLPCLTSAPASIDTVLLSDGDGGCSCFCAESPVLSAPSATTLWGCPSGAHPGWQGRWCEECWRRAGKGASRPSARGDGWQQGLRGRGGGERPGASPWGQHNRGQTAAPGRVRASRLVTNRRVGYNRRRADGVPGTRSDSTGGGVATVTTVTVTHTRTCRSAGLPANNHDGVEPASVHPFTRLITAAPARQAGES